MCSGNHTRGITKRHPIDLIDATKKCDILREVIAETNDMCDSLTVNSSQYRRLCDIFSDGCGRLTSTDQLQFSAHFVHSASPLPNLKRQGTQATVLCSQAHTNGSKNICNAVHCSGWRHRAIMGIFIANTDYKQK